jgi:hypothetical protein
LHRTKVDLGLRFDENGDTLDPLVLQKRLWRLGLYSGTDADGAEFLSKILLLFNPEEMEKERIQRKVILMRYGHQQVSEIEKLLISEIYDISKGLIELIKKESPLQSMHENG